MLLLIKLSRSAKINDCFFSSYVVFFVSDLRIQFKKERGRATYAAPKNSIHLIKQNQRGFADDAKVTSVVKKET